MGKVRLGVSGQSVFGEMRIGEAPKAPGATVYGVAILVDGVSLWVLLLRQLLEEGRGASLGGGNR